MIFESHAHYDDRQYDDDREALLERLPKENVGIVVNVGADLASSDASVLLSQKYDYIYASVGVHPDEVGELSEEGIAHLRELASEEKVVAIGEIGLDYFRKEGEDFKEIQKKWFLAQLELAEELDLPVIVHSRDAAEDTMEILRDFAKKYPERSNPGVVHCYSYSKEMAMEYISMGYFIGIGGVVTFKNAKKLVQCARDLPLDRIVVETDSPYLAPEPHRGSRNNSANIKYVIEKIAEIRGISPEEVEKVTELNARKLYLLRG